MSGDVVPTPAAKANEDKRLRRPRRAVVKAVRIVSRVHARRAIIDVLPPF
jgi:hypothetical protein